MGNDKETNDKKKDDLFKIVCIGGIVVFLFLAVYSFASNKKDKLNVETRQETYQEESSDSETEDFEDVANTDTGTEQNTQVLTASPETEEWQDDDATYNDGFHYEGFPDELLPMVDNDTDGMLKNMQEVLYANGYYSYTEARFQDYAEIDYSAQTVSLSYEVIANETVNVSAVYSRNTKTWNTIIW